MVGYHDEIACGCGSDGTVAAIPFCGSAGLAHAPLLAPLLLALMCFAALPGVRAVVTPPSITAQMLDKVYYAALLSGRDPVAASRKARFRIQLMQREFGMTRSQAAAYVARVMIEEAGGICSGI